MGRNEKAVQIGKRGTPGGCAEPQQYGGDRNYPMSTGKGYFQYRAKLGLVQ